MIFFLLILPILMFGVIIHYAVNDFEGFCEGVWKSTKWFFIVIGVLLLLTITGHFT